MQIVFQREEDIVKVERLGDCQQHCHFLEDSDRIKRNSACRSLAVSEIVKGYAVRRSLDRGYLGSLCFYV